MEMFLEPSGLIGSLRVDVLDIVGRNPLGVAGLLRLHRALQPMIFLLRMCRDCRFDPRLVIIGELLEISHELFTISGTIHLAARTAVSTVMIERRNLVQIVNEPRFSVVIREKRRIQLPLIQIRPTSHGLVGYESRDYHQGK